MAIVSRLKLDHPALGTPGGTALHDSIEAIYQKIGDNMADRMFKISNLDDAASVDLDHNFQVPFDDLRIDLYLWNESTGELTTIDDNSTPPRSAFTIAATTSYETKKVTITNGSGAQRDLAVVVLNDPIEVRELKDVDVLTTPPEDGQAMVYEAATKKWKPGASGDASFKVQSVSDPNAVIKGGYLELEDGTELATYDGSGSASTDFGKDLTVDLDAILGASPANGTAYYLYIDRNALPAPVVQTDTGREVIPVTQSCFKLLTSTPRQVSSFQRYVARGFIRSANSGTVWSGTGAKFGTLAFLNHPALGALFSYVEEKLDTATTAAVKTVTHGLSGKPQVKTLEFYENSTGLRTALNPDNYQTDNNGTTTVFDFSALTFLSGDRVEIALYFVPRMSNGFVSSLNQYLSDWMNGTPTPPSTVQHGRGDKFSIKAGSLLQLDVATGRIQPLDWRRVVKEWDDTTLYLDWSDVTPSPTFLYQIIAGPAPLAAAVPQNGQVYEFTATGQLTDATTSYPCTKMAGDAPTAITAVQKDDAGNWRPRSVDGMVWVTADGNKRLQGDIDDLVPSSSKPVRICVR